MSDEGLTLILMRLLSSSEEVTGADFNLTISARETSKFTFTVFSSSCPGFLKFLIQISSYRICNFTSNTIQMFHSTIHNVKSFRSLETLSIMYETVKSFFPLMSLATAFVLQIETTSEKSNASRKLI